MQGAASAIVGGSAFLVFVLLCLIGYLARRMEKPLDYGSFFVVALGITTALFGFLVAFPLLISHVFKDPTQVLALLSALFGTIVALVGTFFGIKTSADAREGAQQLAAARSRDTTPPHVSSTHPKDDAKDVPTDTTLTATFSKDMDSGTINSATFKLLAEDDQDGFEPVLGDVTYDAPTRTATLKPPSGLRNDTTYQATITARVRDHAGNALAQDHIWHFKVVKPPPAQAGGQEPPPAA